MPVELMAPSVSGLMALGLAMARQPVLGRYPSIVSCFPPDTGRVRTQYVHGYLAKCRIHKTGMEGKRCSVLGPFPGHVLTRAPGRHKVPAEPTPCSATHCTYLIPRGFPSPSVSRPRLPSLFSPIPPPPLHSAVLLSPSHAPRLDPSLAIGTFVHLSLPSPQTRSNDQTAAAAVATTYPASRSSSFDSLLLLQQVTCTGLPCSSPPSSQNPVPLPFLPLAPATVYIVPRAAQPGRAFPLENRTILMPS